MFCAPVAGVVGPLGVNRALGWRYASVEAVSKYDERRERAWDGLIRSVE